MLLLARHHQQQRGLLAAVLLSALRATTAAAMASSGDARLMATTTETAPPPPPPPPALASPGPCGVSEPIHGTVEASNTGDLLKATLVLPTRDNSTAAGLGLKGFNLPFSVPPLFDSGAALAADAAAARCSQPFPLVAFFSGFQSRASSYDRYARHLASWGYASVRYDARFLSITPDSRELGWLTDVVAWALRAAPAGTLSSGSAPSSPDLLFTAGHSRGAKLAALQYAGSLEFARCGSGGGGGGGASGGADPADASFLPRQSLRISSAFLIDPVDNTRFTPASEAYPSAAAALRAQGSQASLAIAAAAKIGPCNPLESGYNRFWPAVGGASSFLLVFNGAGHATFNDAGKLGNGLADWLCGSGDLKREAAMGDTGAAMVSWFDSVASRVRNVREEAGEAAAQGARQLASGTESVSVTLESGSDGSGSGGGGSEEGEGRLRVLIKKRPSPAPRDAAVPSPSAALLQEDFLSWARAAEAAGQVEFEVRGGEVPPPQPAPCSSAKGGAAAAGGGGGGAAATAATAANNVVPFPAAAAAAASLLKKDEAPAAAAAP